MTKSPPNRRKFSGDWDEINYLRDKLLYWCYRRGDRRRAHRYCSRMEQLLDRNAGNHESILGEECWSLLSEVNGDLLRAIDFRVNEIRLIERLWMISAGTPGAHYALEGYTAADLSDRLDLLAILYHDAGNLDRAIEVLRTSQSTCNSRRITFKGKELLKDYQAEKEQQDKSLSKSRMPKSGTGG